LRDFWSKYRDVFLISFLFLIALLLRLYKITEQSLWHEEYIHIANIKICDLLTNIKLLFINVPEYGISPAGLILYYFWIRLLPDAIWIWRLLPITFGCLSVVIIYYLGREIKNWQVGFFASLLMAVSPFNIYIQQEVKSYSFLLFFSLLSWFVFLKYLYNSEKKGWLWIGIFLNLMLPWFHALYLIVPFIQFPLLVCFRRRKRFQDIIFWTVLNLIAVSSYMFWIFWVNPPVYNLTLTEMEQLNIRFIIASLFGIDCAGISNELLPYWKTNTYEIVKNSVWLYLIIRWVIIDYLLLFLIIFHVVFFTFISIKNYLFREEIGKETKQYYLLYSLIISFLPFLLLRIATGKPFFLPLYFYYYFAFLYIVIAYSIFEQKNNVLRVSLIIITFFLFLLQSIGFIQFNRRPDYKNAVAYLDENVKEGDMVLDLQLGANVFETWKAYKKREDYILKPIFSLQSVADNATEMFSKDIDNMENNSLWVLMETTLLTWIYKTDPTYVLVKNLSPFGLKVNIRHFPGKFNLYVLKIERDFHKKFKNVKINVPPFGSIDYNNVIKILKMKTEDEKENQRREEIVQKYFSIWPPFYSYNYILVINSLVQNDEIDIAEKVCDYICGCSPKFYHALFLKGLILYSKNERDEAQEKIEKVFNGSIVFKKMYEDLWNNIISTREFWEKADILHLKKIEENGYHILNKTILTILKI